MEEKIGDTVLTVILQPDTFMFQELRWMVQMKQKAPKEQVETLIRIPILMSLPYQILPPSLIRTLILDPFPRRSITE